MGELGQRVTSSAFAHWQAFYRLEDEQREQAEAARWAALMAATCNGPVTRKDKRLWRPDDFLPTRASPPPPKAATGADALRHVRRIRQAEAEARANRNTPR